MFVKKIFGSIDYANISTNHKGYMIDMKCPIQLCVYIHTKVSNLCYFIYCDAIETYCQARSNGFFCIYLVNCLLSVQRKFAQLKPFTNMYAFFID